MLGDDGSGFAMQPESRDWTAEPRGWREVIRCRRGRHRRMTIAIDGGVHVARCSCGGIELDRSGYWMHPNEVGRRSVAECDKRKADRAQRDAFFTELSRSPVFGGDPDA
jgi:hypothetical protein